MRRDDPLEEWLYMREFASELVARHQILVRYARRRAPVQQDDTGKTGMEEGLEDVRRIQDEYRQVLEAGGPGTTYHQEALLNLIAVSADPASIPFWIALLDYRRPRDTFARRRRSFVFAALAYLAIQSNAAAAYDTLLELTRHPLPEIREPAVEYLGRAYLEAERPVPPEIVAHVSNIATEDRAFGPRYRARMLLGAIEEPIPLDNPGGAYVFKVKFEWDKRIYRSIAVRSEQTLGDLHLAIQDAIDWDDDHLYAFFMSGQVHDSRSMIAHPYLEDAPLFVDEVAVGELGLVKKHKFVYFFDYGDSHEFEVEVVDIHPQAEPGAYPRLVDSKGEAPPQYDLIDDDEWAEE